MDLIKSWHVRCMRYVGPGPYPLDHDVLEFCGQRRSPTSNRSSSSADAGARPSRRSRTTASANPRTSRSRQPKPAQTVRDDFKIPAKCSQPTIDPHREINKASQLQVHDGRTELQRCRTLLRPRRTAPRSPDAPLEPPDLLEHIEVPGLVPQVDGQEVSPDLQHHRRQRPGPHPQCVVGCRSGTGCGR